MVLGGFYVPLDFQSVHPLRPHRLDLNRMTRLNLLLAATTSTLLLTISSARATETRTDRLIEATIQADRVVQVHENAGDPPVSEAVAIASITDEASDSDGELLATPVETPEPADIQAESHLEETVSAKVILTDSSSARQTQNLESQNLAAQNLESQNLEVPDLAIQSDASEQESERISELESEGESHGNRESAAGGQAAGEAAGESDRPQSERATTADRNTSDAPLRSEPETEPIAVPEQTPTNVPAIATTANASLTFDDLIAQGRDLKLEFNDNTPAPRYLNPRPNPLTFPTLVEDVTIIGDQPISLDQAIELALRNNIDLQNSVVSVQRQQETLRSAQSALWPQLDLTSSFTWSDSANSRISIQRQLELTGDRSILQTDPTGTSWNTELRLRYNIFTSGSRDANIRSARERLRLLELEVERQTEATRLSVSEAYYNIQNTDQQVVIAESAVGNSEKSLTDAQSLERAGVGTQFDVLRSEVQLANDQQRLRQAQSDQRVARRTLARLLDLPPNLEVSAGDPIELAGTWNLPLEETILLALRSRAELEQQLAQREIARQEQRAARAGTLPKLAAFASVNLLGNSGDDVSSLTDGYSAGLQFSWQLFDGGGTGAAVRDQELAQQAAELEFANQRSQVRLQVEQAYYQLEASLENVSTSETALKLAEESLNLARLRFQAGVGTQTEVIDAQNDLTQAQGNRVAAIIGYNQALASLRRAVGNHPLLDEIDVLM